MSERTTTRERILAAAEKLFAERGYESASLRAITTEAGANLAAVNYHFRSKEGLIRAVLQRSLGPLNARRIAQLDACEKEAGKRAVPVEGIVRALVEPVLHLERNEPGGGRALKMLLGRMFAEPSSKVRRIFAGELDELVGRFGPAFRRALPGLEPRDLYWRVFFAVGAMAQTLVAAPMVQMLSGGLCDPADVDGTSERLVEFILAGMEAPRCSGIRKGRKASAV